MSNTIKSYFTDKEFNAFFIYFEKVIKGGYEKYNNLSNFFDREYKTDCSTEAQAVRKSFSIIVDLYKNAMIFHGTIDILSNNDYVEIIMREMDEIKKALREQADFIIRNLKNIKGGDRIETLIT